MSIADLRQEYMLAGLSEAEAQRDPMAQFERWFREALDAGVPLANAMTLATVTAEGAPDARVVLLKGVESGGFVFYTNYASRKGVQLARQPAACLVFLWTLLERQVRIEGVAEKVPVTDSDAYFRSRPLGSRLSAWASPQSEPVADRETLERALADMENRYGTEPPRPPHWGGYRLTPHAIEFWQGRENRLHDRLLYRRRNGGWTIERLAP
ncbi:MAG: pyridoxamine 5'-phosphate oxidase [Betaproteobacteria bacterium]|nr:MAG: pyridoxamine 5'-phosphate oxidase [Betaproteobacteria bacterium]